MKKTMLVLVLALLLFTVPAGACIEAEETYRALAELPAPVQAQLEGEYPLAQAFRMEKRIFVMRDVSEDVRQLEIFRKEGGEYRLECKSAAFPSLNRSNANAHASTGDGMYVTYENYTTNKGPGWWCAGFKFRPDTKTWELSYVQCRESDILRFDRFMGDVLVRDQMQKKLFYGKLDINLQTMDIAGIPASLYQAYERMDTQGYAAVKSGIPSQRLDLRSGAGETETSLGQYYDGTPVKMLEDEGDWVKVSVAGIEGYMPRNGLCFGVEMLRVPTCFPWKLLRQEAKAAGVSVYEKPDQSGQVVGRLDESNGEWHMITIIGLVGEEWYHVLFDGGESGYAKAAYFWDGNG